MTGTVERVERFDRGAQFHAVVGGQAGATGQFLGVATVAQDRRPAARARVAKAAAVGVDDNSWFGRNIRCGHSFSNNL